VPKSVGIVTECEGYDLDCLFVEEDDKQEKVAREDGDVEREAENMHQEPTSDGTLGATTESCSRSYRYPLQRDRRPPVCLKSSRMNFL